MTMQALALLVLLVSTATDFPFVPGAASPLAGGGEMCRPRPAPAHGWTQHVPRGPGGRGALSKAGCGPGYRLVGAALAACSGGVWSHPPPVCRPRRHGTTATATRNDEPNSLRAQLDSPVEDNALLPSPASTPAAQTRSRKRKKKNRNRKKQEEQADTRGQHRRKGAGHKEPPHKKKRVKQTTKHGSRSRTRHKEVEIHVDPGGSPGVTGPSVGGLRDPVTGPGEEPEAEQSALVPRGAVREEDADLSCLLGLGGGSSSSAGGFLRAPDLPRANVLKYTKKRNPEPPKNRYLVVLYSCIAGFTFKDPTVDRLYCSQGRWVGPQPVCISAGGGGPPAPKHGEDDAEVSVEDEDARPCEDGEDTLLGCEQECRVVRGRPTCRCFPGYQLSAGSRCTDQDECTEDNGGCASLCQNTPGSFRCSCPEGFRLEEDASSCRDVNECLLRNGHGPCQDGCENRDGGYRCSCAGLPGTRLAVDNHTCEDVDECEGSNNGCSHTCLNTIGSAFCLCPEGMVLHSDWKTCVDVDECQDATIVSRCPGVCVNTPGSYKCVELETSTSKEPADSTHRALQRERVDREDGEEEEDHGDHDVAGRKRGGDDCEAGFRRDEGGECRDIDECTEQETQCSHECLNEPGSFSCSCPSGYDLAEDEATCEDVDECSEPDHGCSHTCANQVGSYRCECPSSWTLSADHRTCSKEEGCQDAGCSHSCLVVEGRATCQCPGGLHLADDNPRQCVDLDECAAGNGGCSHQCVNEMGGFHCQCPDGFWLDEDERSCVDVNECEEGNDVDGVGCSDKCINTEGSFHCGCPEGTVLGADGRTCEVDPEDSRCPQDHGCSHQCDKEHGEVVCRCPSGLAVTSDRKTCHDINECDKEHSCDQHCVNELGTYRCSCSPGFVLEADGHRCRDVDECNEGANCSHDCTNTPGSFRCECPPGHQLGGDASTCEDVDECTSVTAAGEPTCSHECVNEPGSFHCKCPAGLRLVEDGRSCEDVDECVTEGHGCSHGCDNWVGSYRCNCPDGLQLSDDGRTCEDVDECRGEAHRCSHECVNEHGAYRCACPTGYALDTDGLICRDVDECEAGRTPPCQHRCVNEPGSYRCECEDGYRADPANNGKCVDVDECAEGNGGCSHECRNLPGGVECACPPSFTMQPDGRVCLPDNGCHVNNGGCAHECHFNGTVYCLCREGYTAIGLHCEDLDECATVDHSCAHECINTLGSFRCTCRSGFAAPADRPQDCVALSSSSHSCSMESGAVRCGCPPGYRLSEGDGHTCEDVDECFQSDDEDDADAGSGRVCAHACVNTPGSYHCACSPGYAPPHDDPHACEDVDECAGVDQGGCSFACVNTAGSYRCACPLGQRLLADGRACAGIDHCLDNNGGCSHRCSSTVHGAACECPDGFRLDPDNNSTCQDVDECALDNFSCSDECVNTQGSAYCLCPRGRQLGADNKTCEAVDPCRHDNGRCSHHCEVDKDSDGQAICSCPPGYRLLDDKQTCAAVDHCAQNNGGCSHHCASTAEGAACSCPEGLSLQDDLKSCLATCTVLNGGCSHACVSLPGTRDVQCRCPEGWELDDDDKNCRLRDPCERDNGGCSHACVPVAGEARCRCPEGWELDEVGEKTCHVRDATDPADPPHPCQKDNGGCSHGCAVVAEGVVLCSCPEEHELRPDNMTCMPKGCATDNGGCSHTCVQTKDEVACSCPEGLSLAEDGLRCEDDDEAADDKAQAPEASERAQRNGTCTESNGGCSHGCTEVDGSAVCSCPRDTTLAADGRSCVQPRRCDANNGGCSHICRPSAASDGNATCACPPGKELDAQDGVSCRSRRSCQVDNGGCSHECVDREDGDVECSCPDGWDLDLDDRRCHRLASCGDNNGGCSHNCSISAAGEPVCSCPEGFALDENDAATCRDVDECADEDSGCSHNCENTQGSFRCSCPVGYRLQDDDVTCRDRDECAVGNGGCSHSCANTAGSFVCGCPPGFKLDERGLTCSDVDECSADNGNCSHSCVNTPGSFRCGCPANLRLSSSGRHCERPEPCARGWQPALEAKDQNNDIGDEELEEGDHEQEGEPGCEDVNECAADHGCQQICINTPGSYRCECFDGYLLIGKRCVGGLGPVVLTTFAPVPGITMKSSPDLEHALSSTTTLPTTSTTPTTPTTYSTPTTKDSTTITSATPASTTAMQKVSSATLEVTDKTDLMPTATTLLSFFPPATSSPTEPSSKPHFVDAPVITITSPKTPRFAVPSSTVAYSEATPVPPLLRDQLEARLKEKLGCPPPPAPAGGEVRCPGLAVLAHGVYPMGTQCSMRCPRGYHLSGPLTRVCLPDGDWSSPIATCVAAPPPWIRCPAAINLEIPASRERAVVNIPRPASNVDWWRNVESVPIWGKRLSAELGPGSYTISFIATSPASNASASCSVPIIVRDVEKPRVWRCPLSFEVQLAPGERAQAVSWVEPHFTDNVGVEAVFRTKDPGSSLLPGLHYVTYLARDAAGNRASCHFSIGVREYNFPFSRTAQRRIGHHNYQDYQAHHAYSPRSRPDRDGEPCPQGTVPKRYPPGVVRCAPLAAPSPPPSVQRVGRPWSLGPTVRHVSSRTSFSWDLPRTTTTTTSTTTSTTTPAPPLDSMFEESVAGVQSVTTRRLEHHRIRHHHGIHGLAWEERRRRLAQYHLDQLRMLNVRECP